MTGRPHYFQRGEAYTAIYDLSEPTNWTVYVGLGATIDRTNLDWPTMVRELLLQVRGRATTEDAVNRWIQSLGPQRAATTAEALFRGKDPTGWQQNIAGAIRNILYSSRRHLAGQLLSSLSDWANAVAKSGGSVVFVTPNYDDYLWKELARFRERAKWAQDLPPQQLVILGEDQLPQDYSQRGNITCVHIHGYVPSGGQPSRGILAIGEPSYELTGPDSRKLLTQLFASSNVLIVGSSITDGPLVDALIQTASHQNKYKRRAFQAYQGMPWRRTDSDADQLTDLNNARLAAMGITPITPDYFGQVAQVLFDASTWTFKANRGRLHNESDQLRYDNRVGHWWTQWQAVSRRRGMQDFHYTILERSIGYLRPRLHADESEHLKVEVWARWNPNTDRQLALWASSLGPWPSHPRMMRTADIEYDSEIKAVQVFCAGTPMLFADDETRSRWKTYYGFPVWHRLDDKGKFVTGVVIVASMLSSTGPERSSLREDNLDNIRRASTMLSWLGSIVLRPQMDPATKQQILTYFENFMDVP